MMSKNFWSYATKSVLLRKLKLNREKVLEVNNAVQLGTYVRESPVSETSGSAQGASKADRLKCPGSVAMALRET